VQGTLSAWHTQQCYACNTPGLATHLGFNKHHATPGICISPSSAGTPTITYVTLAVMTVTVLLGCKVFLDAALPVTLQ